MIRRIESSLFCFLFLFGFSSGLAFGQTPLSPTQLKANYQVPQAQSVLTWLPRGTYRVLGAVSGSETLSWTGSQIWAQRTTNWSLSPSRNASWGTSGSNLYQGGNSGGLWHYKPGLKWRDYTFEYVVRTNSTVDRDPLGLVFRYQNSKNYYYFYMCGQSGPSNCGTTRLRKVVNGVNTVLFSKDPRVDKKYGYVNKTDYRLRVIVNGTRFRIYSNNTLLIDIQDSGLKEGSFGPYSSSQDRTYMNNFKLIHTESEALVAGPFTGTFLSGYTRLQSKTVGSLISPLFSAWRTKFGYSSSQATLSGYTIDIPNDNRLFEGIISTNGTTSAPGNANSYPYGRQKSGVPKYNVYRGTTKLTATPINKTTYTDKYNHCAIKVGTKHVYTVRMINPSKTSSAASTSVTVTHSNTKPTIKKVADQTVNRKTSKTIDIASLINDVDAANSSLKVTTNSKNVTVSGTKLTFLYPTTVSFSSQKVTVTVTDCHGATATVTFTVNLVNRKPLLKGSVLPKTATERIAYAATVKGSDPDGDKLAYQLKRGPTGAKVDPKTGKVTWTPKTGDSGKSFTFEVEVCDDQSPKLCSIQRWKVTVGLGNRKAVFTSKPPTAAYSGERQTYQPKIKDPNTGDKHTWKLKTKGHPSAKVDAKTGQFSWTPTSADTDKPFKFEIEVCDNGTPPSCNTQTFTMTPRKRCRVDTDCKSTWICIPNSSQQWVCLSPGCAAAKPKCSKTGNVCQNSTCKANPCATVKCSSGTFCRPSDGKCIAPCAGKKCGTDEVCRDGKCSKDACASAGSACKSGEICDAQDPKNPKCIKNPCGATTCRHGRVCDQGNCIDNPCGLLSCPDSKTQRCVAGQCIDLQDCAVDINCPNDQVCIGKKCRQAGCYVTSAACTSQQICVLGTCKINECPAPGSTACTKDQFCRPLSNLCIDSCGNVSCSSGEQCRDGKCEKNPCASVKCSAGEVCVAGTCEKEQCSASNVCKHGRVCDVVTNGCTDDACKGVTCPDSNQVCSRGQCSYRACQFDKNCPTGQICVQQKCIKPTCQKEEDCQQGELCRAGQCVKNDCEGKQCSAQQLCRAGNCVDTCAGVFCKQGERCVDGKCSTDPCGGVSCQADEVCVNGKCRKDQCKGVTDACSNGRICRVDKCIDDPCGSTKCPQGLTCKGGQCSGKRSCTFDKDCPTGGVCTQGNCAAPGCYSGSCKSGELCLAGKCVTNPCDNKQCPDGAICRPSDGKCAPACPYCETGQVCLNGSCVADPCKDVKCQSGEVCEDGKCVKAPCKDDSQTCRYQRACSSKGCKDDSCKGVVCPQDSACKAGSCVRTKKPQPEPEPEPASEPTVEATEDASQVESVTKEEIGGTDTGPNNTDKLVPAGCRCQSSQPSTPLLLFFLVVFALFIQRKSSGRHDSE